MPSDAKVYIAETPDATPDETAADETAADADAPSKSGDGAEKTSNEPASTADVDANGGDGADDEVAAPTTCWGKLTAPCYRWAAAHPRAAGAAAAALRLWGAFAFISDVATARVHLRTVRCNVCCFVCELLTVAIAR